MTTGERSRNLLLAGVAIVLGVAGYFLFREESEPSVAKASSASSGEATEPGTLPSALASASTASAVSSRSTPQLDRARADAIRAQLKALYGAVPAPTTAENKPNPAYPVMPHNDGPNDPALGEYIHQRIKDDYLPLAKSCYENALVQSPKLRGRLIMSFKIVGDRRVGGVVDSADIDPASSIHDDAFDECVKESMMSISFDAPPDDKSVTVKYPLIFSPDHDDGGDSDGS